MWCFLPSRGWGTVWAVIEHEAEMRSHHLGPHSSLTVLHTNISKSRSLDPGAEWFWIDRFSQPVDQLRCLKRKDIAQRFLLIMSSKQVGSRPAVVAPAPERSFPIYNAGLQLMFPLSWPRSWLTFHLYGALWVQDRACKEWDNWSFPSWLESAAAFPLNRTEFRFAALDFTGSSVQNKAYRCEGLLQPWR